MCAAASIILFDRREPVVNEPLLLIKKTALSQKKIIHFSDMRKGDLIVRQDKILSNASSDHLMIFAGGQKPIIHAKVDGRVRGVIRQSWNTMVKAEKEDPVKHVVYRITDSVLAREMLRFAVVFSLETHSEQFNQLVRFSNQHGLRVDDHSVVLPTAYSVKKLAIARRYTEQTAIPGFPESKKVGVFRALKSLVRAEGDHAKRVFGTRVLSSKGTTCSEFVLLCLQGAVLKRFLQQHGCNVPECIESALGHSGVSSKRQPKIVSKDLVAADTGLVINPRLNVQLKELIVFLEQLIKLKGFDETFNGLDMDPREATVRSLIRLMLFHQRVCYVGELEVHSEPEDRAPKSSESHPHPNTRYLP